MQRSRHRRGGANAQCLRDSRLRLWESRSPHYSTSCTAQGPQDVFSLRGWNQVELLCVGARVRVAINGVCVTDWIEPEPSSMIAPGPIALQQHWMNIGEEQVVLFRGLVVSEDPQDYLITTR